MGAAGLQEVDEEFFIDWFVKCASQVLPAACCNMYIVIGLGSPVHMLTAICVAWQLAGGQQEVAAQLQTLLNNKNPSEAPAEEEQAIAI